VVQLTEVKVEKRPLSEFSYGQRALARYRKKIDGLAVAGYYRQIPLLENKIVIPDHLPKEVEDAVLEHEKEHHKQNEDSQIYWTTKLSWLGIALLIPSVWFTVKPAVAASIAVIVIAALLEHFYVVEKDANEDIDWDEVRESADLKSASKPEKWFEYFLYVTLMIPGNIEMTVREVWREIISYKQQKHETTQ